MNMPNVAMPMEMRRMRMIVMRKTRSDGRVDKARLRERCGLGAPSVGWAAGTRRLPRPSRWVGGGNPAAAEISRSPCHSAALEKRSENYSASESDRQQVRFMRHERHDLGQVI